ncbi:MAG: Response regulator receiver domain, partial [Actinomycetota bacterium]
DTALIDLRLGEEDGRIVARSLLQQIPQLRIIFMTGFANWAAIASLESVGRVLRKPFSLDLLVSAILEGMSEPR